MLNRLKILILWMPLVGLISETSHAELGLLSNQLSNSAMKHLIGNWEIKDSLISAEGNWIDGPGPTWNFYPILNGHAIQDDWVSPPADQPAPENGRQYGTNIRIFNPQENQWEMAWASLKGQKIDTFTAIEEGGQIIMSGFFAGAESKITFFNLSPQTFDWKLEQQVAGTWSEVYRIRASKAP